MQATSCLNCGASIQESHLFCGNCGQKVHTHRFTIHELFHEIFHAFTHADKSIVQLVKQLAINPGKVLREYIIERKRKKYFNPFTFLLLVLGFTVFVSSVFHPLPTNTSFNTAQIEAIKDPVKKQKMISIVQKQAKVNHLLETKMNWTTFLSTPFMSLAFWVFFRRKGLNYAEHLVGYTFLVGFIMLVSAVTFFPLMGLTKGTPWYMLVFSISIIFQLIYFAVAYKTFLQLKNYAQASLASLAGLVGSLLFIILTSIAMFIYLFL